MPDLRAIAREIVSGLYWRGRTWEEVRAEVMDDGGLSEMLDTPPCPTADAQMIAGIADELNTAISQALQAERERCAKIAEEIEWAIPMHDQPSVNELTDDAAQMVCQQIATAIRKGE